MSFQKSFVFIFLFAFLIFQLEAQELSNPSENIFYKNNGFKIDGKGDEWSKHKVSNLFVLQSDSLTSDSIEIYSVWDEFFFYAFVKVFDKNLIYLQKGNNNEKIWQNDGIELYIDPKHDTSARMNLNDFNVILNLQAEYTIFTATKARINNDLFGVPKSPNEVEVYFNAKSQIFGTINDTTDIDTGFQIELQIPWTALGILPKSGDSIRLEFCVNDLDVLCDTSAFVSYTVWPEGFNFNSWSNLNDWGRPLKWKTVFLLGKADFATQLARKNPQSFWYGLLAILILLALTLLYFFKYNRVKNIQSKASIENKAFISILENQEEIAEKQELPSQKIFDEAKIYLENNLSESISSPMLAAALGLNVRKFQRICKEELETTPSNFITLHKIEKAAKMLKTKKMNVSEVAYEVGFSDPLYFSKVFKKYFNISPKNYV